MKHLAPLAIALSLFAPAAALAGTTDEAVTVRVSHADLNLAQPDGAAIMLNRLERASLSACGASTFSFREVQDEVRSSACFRNSLERAVATLASPSVNAIYRAQSQERLATN
ncbi:UrcA family protein [Phenylobacterium sp. LjRoot225]|uniref:UrcA family protein n=1 Tax=Phenylobacterium sp. LjRoot225 TaxID=3342285 RepID=UPI003ED02B0D